MITPSMYTSQQYLTYNNISISPSLTVITYTVPNNRRSLLRYFFASITPTAAANTSTLTVQLITAQTHRLARLLSNTTTEEITSQKPNVTMEAGDVVNVVITNSTATFERFIASLFIEEF